MQQRVRQWAANRTTDRQSLRYAIWDNHNLKQRLAAHEEKDRDQDMALQAKINEQRQTEAGLGDCEMKLMNAGADVNRLKAGRNVWRSLALAAFGLVGVIAVLK